MGESLARRDARDEALQAVEAARSEAAKLEGQEVAVYEWRGMLFAGYFAQPYPEKPYVTAVTRVSPPLTPEAAAQLKRRKDLPLLHIHPRVGFDGTRYLLGLNGDTLILLSGEDIVYCAAHPRPTIHPTASRGTELEDFPHP